MSEPKRTWWLSILSIGVLFLIVRSADTIEINNEESNTTQLPTDENNFDVVDIGQRSDNGDLQGQTGQTTRIITSQEVDNNFWLKHLGEDFKYAIHIRVEDDAYNGIHNMTEDETNYDDKNDYSVNEAPVENNQSDGKQVQNQLNQENLENPVMKNTSSNVEENANAQHNNSTETGAKEEQEVKENEEIYTLQSETETPSMVSQSSSENPTVENAMQQDEQTNTTTQHNMQYSSEQQTQQHHIQQAQQQTQQQQHKQHQEQQHERYSQQIEEQTQKSHSNTQQNHQKQNKRKKAQSTMPNQKKVDSIRALWNLPQPAPVVVTLPNDESTLHHSADKLTPIIVNMPPVIYHQAENPIYEYENQTTQQHTEPTLPTRSQYASDYVQPSPHYENTIFRQYNQPNASPSHLPTQLSHNQYYSSPQLNEPPTTYRNNGIYPSFYQTPQTPTAYFPNSNQHQRQRAKSIDSVHLMLRKTEKPYNQHSYDNENVF